MRTCIPSHRLKRSWHSCPRRVDASNKNIPSMHHPQGQNVTTSMVGLKKKTYTKISPRMVNPWDIAGNAEEEEETVMKKVPGGQGAGDLLNSAFKERRPVTVKDEDKVLWGRLLRAPCDTPPLLSSPLLPPCPSISPLSLSWGLMTGQSHFSQVLIKRAF